MTTMKPRRKVRMFPRRTGLARPVYSRSGPDRALIQKHPYPGMKFLDESVPIVERKAGCRNGLSDPDADMDRMDDGASLPHRSPPPLHSHRNDWHLRLDRHDQSSLLERQELSASTARPFRKDEERIACAQRRRTALDRSQRSLAIVALDRDESANVKEGTHDRKLVKLGLVEDVQLRMQRPEQDGGVDIALMIRAEDHWTDRYVLAAGDLVADAAQRQCKLHTGMS